MAHDYAHEEVLHDVTFEAASAERLGIVGRTGHGKSTLSLCLLRAIQHTRGSVLIDGVDISRLSLQDLRSRVCLIPQEAVLTSGNLRQALDINGEHSDAEIFGALRCVHLLEEELSLGNTPGRFADLEQVVTAGGGNFSRGERQLLTLSRALLKRSKLLIMDEATSSVDQAQVQANFGQGTSLTHHDYCYLHRRIDKKIRQTIKESFAGVTMLVIAHRLETIMDFDRILFLQDGRVAECDTPRALLQNPDSCFYKLCATHGEEELQNLKRMAGL